MDEENTCENIFAPKGQVWVCGACGKRSQDRFGDHPINMGWDVSCFLHAVLCYEDKLSLNDNKRVREVLSGGVVDPQP